MTNQTTVLYIAVTDGDSPDDPVLEAIDRAADAVYRASSATDGLKRLEDVPVDCLVSDVTLPDLDVVRFVELVREGHPSLPIVLVGDAPDLADRAVGAGATYSVSDPDEVADRVRRTVATRRAESALDDHGRLKDAVRRIAHATAGASTRSEIEDAVYDHLVASDLYLYAWIGEYDADADELRLRVPVSGAFGAGELGSLVDEHDPSFVAEAVDRGDVVATSGTAGTRSASVETAAGSTPAHGDLSTAAVPLVGTDAVHGVVLLSTTRLHAFDGSERDLLAELGEVVGHAIGRTDGRADELAENLIHELRTPLGIAKAHLEIGRENDDEEAFEEVRSALDRLEHTIENVSTLDRFDGVEATSTRDLADTASAAWAGLRTDEADLVIEDSTPIPADHDLLERMFSNLFRNAVEHGSTGSQAPPDDVDERGSTTPRPHAREDAAEQTGVTVRIGTSDGGFYVEDDGPGIPEDERDRVFERGYSTTDGGLGIGLSIVEGIVEAHGWTIGLDASSDGGARFEVTGVDRPGAPPD